jgi:hypothetical protein
MICRRGREHHDARAGTASNQVLSSAQALSTEGTRLKTQVDTFLARVRAG